MAEAGVLSVKITADDAELITALARSRAAIKNTDDQISASVASFARLGGAALAASVIIGEELVRSSINSADALNKQSQSAGVTAKSLSELQFAAGFADVSNEDLTASLVKLNKATREAATGNGAQAAAFAMLGVKVTDVDGKIRSVDAVLKDVADSFAEMEDGNQKTTAALDLFGRSGAQLIPLLNAGSAGLADMADKAQRTGNVVSNETAAAAEVFNDSLALLKANVTGTANVMAAELLPALNRITAAMNDAAEDGGILHAALVGFGGVIKESFSRENFTPLEHAKAQLSDLTTELGRAQQLMEGMKISDSANPMIDEIAGKIQDLQNKIVLTTQWRDRLLNPPKDAPELKLTAPDMSSILAMNDLVGKSLEAEFKKYEQIEEKQRSQSQAIDEQIGALRVQGATMGQSAGAVELYKMQMQGATAAQLEAARAAYATIDAFNAAKEIKQIGGGAKSGNDKAVDVLQEKYARLNAIIAQNPELQQQAGEAAAALATQYQNTVDTQIALGQAANQAFIDQMAERVEVIQFQNDSEIEMAIKRYETDLELLEQALLNQVITEAKYQEISAQQQKAHEDTISNMRLKSWDDLKTLTKLSWQNQAMIISNTLSEMTATLSTKSRAMFEINKRVTQANVLMKGIESVQAAYAAGNMQGGPWVGAAYAAVAAAYSATQLSAIESTQFGGGARSTSAGIPSAAIGGAGAEPGQAGMAAPQGQRLVVEEINPDALFSGKTVRALVEKLQEFQRDGGTVVIA